MPRLERVWDPKNKRHVLALTAAIIAVVALVDWWTMPFVSLGFLYLFPIMLAAGFLPRWAVAALGVICAVLAELFSSLERSWTRLSLEMLALAGCGLFVAELIRNRRMTMEAQERLRILVETSPVAILTIDEHGFIELANQAANQLMLPREGHLVGSPVAAFCRNCTTPYGGNRLRRSGRRCNAAAIAGMAKRSRRMCGFRLTVKVPTRSWRRSSPM
jgi:two-component system, LuxR family, sensor kinase FixL